MRCLIVTTDFPPSVGGIQRYLFQLYKHLSGVQVSVLAPLHPEAVAFDSGHPFRIRRTSTLVSLADRLSDHFKLFSVICQEVIKTRTDILLAGHVYPAGWAVYLAARLLGKPYIVHTYGSELGGLRQNPLAFKRMVTILQRATRVITISQVTRQLVIELGVSPARIEMIYPGVDPEMFSPSGAGASRDSSCPILLTVARLVERKGHDMVIRVMPRILDVFPEAEYWIIGRGPEETKLRLLAATLGVAKNVVFHGYVPDDDLPGFYRAADLFVMPSRERNEDGDFEGFGIVYLEAAASGKPVVGGRSGGVSDAIVEGRTGILVDPQDPNDLVAAVLQILTDLRKAEQMGMEGRRHVERNFTWVQSSRRMTEILDKFIREAAVWVV